MPAGPYPSPESADCQVIQFIPRDCCKDHKGEAAGRTYICLLYQPRHNELMKTLFSSSTQTFHDRVSSVCIQTIFRLSQSIK
jgi:hypothetical protein